MIRAKLALQRFLGLFYLSHYNPLILLNQGVL